MKTLDFTENIEGAAEALKSGGLVAVPTETVYGLAVNTLDGSAAERLFAVKGRPENKPVSLMVSGAGAINALCEDVPQSAFALAETFWPGPLTIVLKAKDGIPDIIRAGGRTVGLRCPEHKKTLALLEKLPFPLAVPSANPSGMPSPVKMSQVLEYFDGKIDGYIDGGECAIGRESTVIDMTMSPYKILRQGVVSEYDISMALLANLTIIGITGGTGCGKTTALETLKDMGALILDMDEVYHELLVGCLPMRERINERFPGALPGGGDTKELGRLVFSDPQALADLNAITHRFVGEEMMCRLSDWAFSGGSVAAIDAIALIESGTGALCKAVIGITAPVEERVRRIVRREGVSKEYARLRIAAQKPDEFFETNCDRTIANDSTPEKFSEKCRAAFEEIINRK